MRRLLVGSFVAWILAGPWAPVPASAQEAWEGRARVAFNAGAQLATERLDQATDLTRYLEPAPVTAGLPEATVPLFDAGLAVRLAGNFGVGVALSYLSKGGTADVRAAIPHPFFFARLRPIEGQAIGVAHAELAAHTNAVYVIVSRRVDVALSGGATFFKLDQSLVEDVTFNESYPYDTATFAGARLALVTASKVGYNAAADVTWKMAPRWGIGGLVRFARARIPLLLNDEEAGTVNVGGFQAGVGLRVMF